MDRAALRTAARSRASDLVDQEIIPATRQIIRQLTVSAIDGNADAGEPQERIMKSPAFSEARARMLASVVLNGKR